MSKQHLRKLDSMSDEEAIHIAELATGGGNVKSFRKPCVHHFVEDTVKVILVVEEFFEPVYSLTHTDELGDRDYVEIDEGFNVNAKHGCTSNLVEIYQYLTSKNFISLEGQPQQDYLKGTLKKKNGGWFVYWNDKKQGLTNCSLPVHPDDIWKDDSGGGKDDDLKPPYYHYKEGDEIEFFQVTFCSKSPYFDCAKLKPDPAYAKRN